MKKTIKSILAVALCFIMLIGTVALSGNGFSDVLEAISVRASAAETVSSGTCGDNLTWTLDNEGTLTISGTGKMNDYYSNSTPWYSSKDSIKKVIIENGVTSIGLNEFENCSSLTSITIPESVTTIDHAFAGCSSLTSITIPDSVTSIVGNAFINCSSLTGITVKAGNKNYRDIDGVLFNKNKTELICYPEGKADTSYIIPDSVTEIGESAFWACRSLTSITIPDGVTSIGDYAFLGCSSLTSITIPDGVTSIGDETFSGCLSLTCITIPDSVTKIGVYAFGLCFSLASITIPDSVKEIGYGAFKECRSLTSIIIPDSVTSISAEAFYHCTSLTSITIPDRVTSIGGYAFYDCTGLTSVTIPDGVTSIGEDAFYNCTSLTDVYYAGSKSDREKIDIGDGNESLLNATWHYGSAEPDNPTADAVINAKSGSVSYGTNVVLKATASGVPTGYYVAIYNGNSMIAEGDNSSVARDLGKMTSSRTYTVKVVDASGNVQYDANGNTLQKDVTISVNSGLFAVIIALIRSLFGITSSATIQP